MKIYKIMTRAEWDATEEGEKFWGAVHGHYRIL